MIFLRFSWYASFPIFIRLISIHNSTANRVQISINNLSNVLLETSAQNVRCVFCTYTYTIIMLLDT
ncbi:hypothetical protein PUN28_006827 [Cardiocondyla obscurior]|uniref:Secreted protein n=1 Tax=Cardiocondyla obscurior TaxID=286306 RepID=A0AAW2G1L0_9HYME